LFCNNIAFAFQKGLLLKTNNTAIIT